MVDGYVQLAQQAGKAVGTGYQNEMLGRLILSESLDDTTREQLGFAAYTILERKQAGESSISLWQYVQRQLGGSGDKPLNLVELDDAKLGLLAFAGGLCSDDRSVSLTIRQYVKQVVRGRVWQTSNNFAR